MRKLNLLFFTLMLVFASKVYAQDIVYLDFDRTDWTATAPDYAITDAGVLCVPQLLLDDDHRTYLAFPKPGITSGGKTGPDNITDLGFVIDMKTAQEFDYIRFAFRTSNTYARLRPQLVSLYGSNDATTPTFTTGTWTQIRAGGEDKFMPPLADQDGAASIVNNNNIDVDNTAEYRYVKVVFEEYIPDLGNTLNMADFYVGKTTTDKVVINPGDVSFGDVEAGATVTKELAIKGYNLDSSISYTDITGDGASAFTVVRKPGTYLSSTLDSVVVTFKPTERKLYEAQLTINMTKILEPQTITLIGNGDFDLPVKISSSTDHWYYIQFESQATAGTVLTKPAASEGLIEQLPLSQGTDSQLWKVTGSWDNYKVINKLGQELTYISTPDGEDQLTGEIIPGINNYITTAAGDAFGFVRYKTTESWQLNNISSTITPANKTCVSDDAGQKVGSGALNSAGTQLKFIESSVPSFVIPGDTISLGAVRKNTTEDLAVTIGGLNLTGDIVITLTEDADQVYTLKTSSLPAAGGLLEVTFAPVAYKKISYATITLTNGSLSESFVISATSDLGISKYYVYAGETDPWGEREDGEKVTVIPTLKAEDEVWIAGGEYTVAQMGVPANVTIYGGFSGIETSVDQRVMAAGGKSWEFANSAVLKNSAALILSITGASTVIDGITFEGTTVSGRAIQNVTASATGGIIRNCIMKNFNSFGDGGGINVRYKTEIYNCLITNNNGYKGGGGYLDGVIIHDCEVTGNSVPTDGASSIGNINGGGGGLLLVNCEAYNLYVANNTASYGGGLFPRTTSKVYNCIIVDNSAKSGGGISFDERDSGTLIYNVTVADNHATLQGGTGGVNFAANAAGRSAKLYNSILWGNTDVIGEYAYNIGISGSVDATPEIKNIIIDDLEYYEGENPTLVIIDGIAEDDFANLFVAGSWVTSSTSPGRNKGFRQLTEEVTDPDTGEIIVEATYLEFTTGKDYAGNSRIFETIDIGPYEYNVVLSVVNPDSDIEGNVIDTKYYNIQGIEVTVPVINNVYIKKELLDTGKVRATKVLFTNTYMKL